MMIQKYKRVLGAVAVLLLIASVVFVVGFTKNKAIQNNTAETIYYAVQDPLDATKFVWRTIAPDENDYTCSSGQATCTIKTSQTLTDNVMPPDGTYTVENGLDKNSLWVPIAPR